MSVILTKEQFDENIYTYYAKHYGVCEADIWHEQPAVNVRVFERNNKIIAIKSHMLNGEIEVKEYDKEC